MTNEKPPKYFHTLIKDYLDKEQEIDISKREQYHKDNFLKLIKIFNYNKRELFIVVNVYRDFKYHKILCWNHFELKYLHDGYGSRTIILLYDNLTKKWIDVSINSYVISAYSENVKFKTILAELNKV